MKKNSLNKDTFQNFREWLLSRDRGNSHSNVDAAISRIRNLEDLLDKTYVEGETVDLLHVLYERLSSATTRYSGKAKADVIKEVKKNIDRAKCALNDKKGEFGKSQSRNVPKYKSVLNAYIAFLEDMFPEFKEKNASNEEIQKVNQNKISGFQRLTPDFFKKGIVGLLRKAKVFLSSDSDTITMTMETFHQLLDDYAKLHGANVNNDIYRTTSFITMDGSRMVSDWEVVLADKMIITAGDFMINQSDVREVCFDPVSGSLNLSYDENYENSIELPSFASEKGIDNELSVHVMSQPPIPDQVNLIHELREVCYRIKDEMKPYIRVKGKKSEEVNYNDKLSAAMESINHNNLANLTNVAYDLLRRYGDGFHIELAIQ